MTTQCVICLNREQMNDPKFIAQTKSALDKINADILDNTLCSAYVGGALEAMKVGLGSMWQLCGKHELLVLVNLRPWITT